VLLKEDLWGPRSVFGWVGMGIRPYK